MNENLEKEAYYVLINIIENKITPVIYSMSQFDTKSEQKVIEAKSIIFGDLKDNPNIHFNPHFKMTKELEARAKISSIFNNMIDCINNETIKTIYRRIRNIFVNYYDEEMINNTIDMLKEYWDGYHFTSIMIISIFNMLENNTEIVDFDNIEEHKICALIQQIIKDEIEKNQKIC